jgi:regulator of protease activity HflC (stomatin/prohibitin superfamily)
MSTAKVKLPGGGLKGVGLIVAVLVVLIASATLYATFTTYVLPSEVAVRQVYLGPKKGIQQDVYGPGLHFVMPGYERLHRFQRDIQLLEFNDNKVSGSANAHVQPSIRIQTSEGYQVTVDVTISYRVVDPYKVITAVGPGNLYETSLMVPRSDKVLRQKLGELNAEDFYAGPKRRQKAEEARHLLEKEVEGAGIQVWNVMVRHYTYDSRYQEAIEQRKIQDQTVFKNRAEAIAASREAEKNRVTAEGQAIVDVERERGRGEVKKIEAEADLYYRQKVADGDLLVALAEAEGTRLENAALEAAGASNLVGLEMAEVMQGSAIIVVPTDGPGAVNPLDLDSLLRGW